MVGKHEGQREQGKDQKGFEKNVTMGLLPALE